MTNIPSSAQLHPLEPTEIDRHSLSSHDSLRSERIILTPPTKNQNNKHLDVTTHDDGPPPTLDLQTLVVAQRRRHPFGHSISNVEYRHRLSPLPSRSQSPVSLPSQLNSPERSVPGGSPLSNHSDKSIASNKNPHSSQCASPQRPFIISSAPKPPSSVNMAELKYGVANAISTGFSASTNRRIDTAGGPMRNFSPLSRFRQRRPKSPQLSKRSERES